MSNLLLHADSVSFTYSEGTRALENVSFPVRTGEFVAILASNGSGKSTLLKLLVGLLKPSEGSVKFDGKDIRAMKSKDLYQRMGLVLQNPNDQLFGTTVEEDVAFGPRNLGLTEEEIDRRVTQALDSVDAAGLRSRAIHHLSFGQQKRVALAGILAMQPSILILDEPTAGLDPAAEALMMRLLHTLNREQHITIILATHAVDMLPLFAGRICVLNRGKLLRDGLPEDVLGDQNFLETAGLRLPYVSRLLHELKHHDGVPINGLPLTIGEARKRLLEVIPEDLFRKAILEGGA